jgi:hypothetical protein
MPKEYSFTGSPPLLSPAPRPENKSKASGSIIYSESTKVFLGHTVKRDDGYLLMMLDLTPADVLLKYFWQGRVVGKEEEKQRLAQVIHDSFSPHLLAAFFLVHGIREHLEKRHSGEAKQLAKVAELLNETIQALAAGVSGSDPERDRAK